MSRRELVDVNIKNAFIAVYKCIRERVYKSILKLYSLAWEYYSIIVEQTFVYLI